MFKVMELYTRNMSETPADIIKVKSRGIVRKFVPMHMLPNPRKCQEQKLFKRTEIALHNAEYHSFSAVIKCDSIYESVLTCLD